MDASRCISPIICRACFRPTTPVASGFSRTFRTTRAKPRSSNSSARTARRFFGPLHDASGGGYPNDTVAALWNLVWRGLITNDTFHALRAFTHARAARKRQRRPEPHGVPIAASGAAIGRRTLDADRARGVGREGPYGVSLQVCPPHGLGRRLGTTAPRASRRADARGGDVRGLAGGFGVVYPVLKAMEESGRIRRGYFVAGLGATQFALPGALDLLRSLRDPSSAAAGEGVEVVVLSATDPANPYGAALRYPAVTGTTSTAPAGERQARLPTRTVGATVILVDGAIAAWLARGDRQLVTFLPDSEPDRSKRARAVARVLIDRARTGDDSPRGMLIEEIDGLPPGAHALAPFLIEAGFVGGALGFQATLPCPKVTRSSGRRRRSTTHLAGRLVTRFESVYPALTRVDHDHPVAGRTVEARRRARQAHPDDVLGRSRPAHAHADERQLARSTRRARGGGGRRATCACSSPRPTFVAVGFNVPVAELLTARELTRHAALRELGPDLLDASFDAGRPHCAPARRTARPLPTCCSTSASSRESATSSSPRRSSLRGRIRSRPCRCCRTPTS